MAEVVAFTIQDAANDAEDWPEPQTALATAGSLPAPVLPLDAVLPGRWPAWVRHQAARAGAPVDFIVGGLLSMAGGVLGNARWGSPWDGWKHPPIVNAALVGLPSSGKSPGLDAVASPVRELERELNADWDQRLREHRTQCQAAKEKRTLWEAEVKSAVKAGNPPPWEPADAKEPAELRKRRLLSTSPTMEAARDLSRANPRGLILKRDELAGFIGGMDAYSTREGAERAFWLESFEGRDWTADRVKDGDDGSDIQRLVWAICGGIQPDRLASVLLRGDDDGLAARFLYYWPAPVQEVSPRPDSSPPPFDLADRLARLRELPMLPGDGPVILPFTESALEFFAEARAEAKRLETEVSGLLVSWVGKMPGMVVRLAAILEHLAWLDAPAGTPSPEAIGPKAVSRAMAFMLDYAYPMARRSFGEAALPEAERDGQILARWLLRQSPVPEMVNARDIRRMAGGPGIKDAKRLRAALDELADMGFVRPVPEIGGGLKGRARGDWRVNPRLRERRP